MKRLSLLLLTAVILLAALAPLIAPYDPTDLSGPLRAAPSLSHWLGTDILGRDVLSRLLYAGRTSLCVAFGAVVIGMALGILVGAFAGFVGGSVEMALLRLTDLFMVFPEIMLLLVWTSLFGGGVIQMITALGLLSWMQCARLVTTCVASLKRENYILSAEVSGLSKTRILFIHLLPQTRRPCTVAATNGLASALLSESALSFLGLGVMPPQTSWGTLLTDAQSLSTLLNAPWIWLPPALAILATLTALRHLAEEKAS